MVNPIQPATLNSSSDMRSCNKANYKMRTADGSVAKEWEKTGHIP
jgi:hypothetical protein